MRRVAVSFSLLATMLAANVGGAAGGAEMLKASGKVSVDKAKAGGEFKVAVVVELQKGWHAYSETTKEPYVATSLKLTAPKGFTVGKPMFPKSKKMKLGGEPMDVFEGTFAIGATVKTEAMVKPGKYTLEGELKYQTCNDKTCLRPTTTKISIPVEVVAKNGKSNPANKDVFDKAPFKSAWRLTPGPRVAMIMPLPMGGGALFAGGMIEAISHQAETIGDHVKSELGRGHLSLSVIFLLLVGGLLSAFSPCVIPVIPMTVAYFGNQARQGGGKTKALLLALSYVGGITVLYSVMGMTAVLIGKSLSFILQGFGLWLLMVVLFGAMGLSMFGLFEIPVPSFVAQKAGARTGFAGAFIMGLIAAVLFLPCAGPVVGGLATGLVGFAATHSTPVVIRTSLPAFIFYCLGLGAPFLILAMLSGSALSKAPKGGEWTVSVKKIFGMVFLGLALFFSQNVPANVIMATFIVGCGIYLMFFEKGLGIRPIGKVVRLATAAMIMFAGVSLGMNTEKPKGPVPTGAGEIAWAPYSDLLLADAKKQRKPVMIDFTAVW